MSRHGSGILYSNSAFYYIYKWIENASTFTSGNCLSMIILTLENKVLEIKALGLFFLLGQLIGTLVWRAGVQGLLAWFGRS